MNEARVIAGSGRSGTTWVLDVLGKSNAMRTIFEPLKTVTRRVPDYEYAYLPDDARVDDLKSFLTGVFAGDFKSIWSDYRIIPSRLRPGLDIFASRHGLWNYAHWIKTLLRHRRRYRPQLANPRILVKFIRANLMIEWLQRNFDARVAFVVRHPGAVVESQLRLGGESWDPHLRLARYRKDSRFVQRFSSRYGELLSRKLSAAQANTLIWCIENQYPVERQVTGNYGVFYYEHLARGDVGQWNRMVGCLGLERIPDESLLVEPSQQASGTFGRNSPRAPGTPGWMKRLSECERAEIQSVLESVGVEFYAIDDPNPRQESL
jgi:hypothetical protein